MLAVKYESGVGEVLESVITQNSTLQGREWIDCRFSFSYNMIIIWLAEQAQMLYLKYK